MAQLSRTSQTKSFNFLVEKTNTDDSVTSKRYFTKAAIRKDYGISSMTIHRMINVAEYNCSLQYKCLKITRIKEPARQVIQLS